MSNLSTLEQLIEILRKEHSTQTLDEKVFLIQNLDVCQISTPKSTILSLMIQWASIKGLSLSMARTLASVDQTSNADAWMLNCSLSELQEGA